MKKLTYISVLFFLVVLATSSCKKVEVPCDKEATENTEKRAVSTDVIIENGDNNETNGKPITDPENEDDEGLIN